MSNFKPKQFILNNVNNGQKYEDGEGLQPSAANDVVEGVAFCEEQRQAIVQTPEIVENGGNVGVKWVDTTINGRTHKKLQFENLKGGRNARGFNPKGVWSALEQYGIDDDGVSVVIHGENSYYALVEEVPVGESPENDLYWAWIGAGGGEVNKIDTVKVNGSALPITDKAVDIALANVATSGLAKDLDGRWDLSGTGGAAGSAISQKAYVNNTLKANLLVGTLLAAGELNYWYISGKKNGEATSHTDAIIKFNENKRIVGTRSTVAGDGDLTITTKDYVDSKESASNKKDTLSDSTTEYPSMQAVKRARAIGINSGASGTDSSAYGVSAVANGEYSIALGYNAYASDEGCIAIGRNSRTQNGAYYHPSNNAIAIGTNSVTYYNAPNAIAIGYGSQVQIGANVSGVIHCNSIAIGNNAKILGQSPYSLAIGNGVEIATGKWYCTALGHNAKVTSSDSDKTMRLGASDLSALKCAVSLTTSSDTRDKADINTIDSKKCLDIITQVEPIQYVRNDRDYYIDRETKEFDQVAYTQQTKKGDRIRVGVKAQQLKQVLDTVFENDNHSDIVYDNHYDAIKKGEEPIGENKLEMSYSKLVPILIGAIQELQKEIEELKNK